MAEPSKDGKTPGDGKVAITIRLPADQVKTVDELAEEELRTRSAQIQKMLDESIDKQQPSQGGKR